jgi:hypothetical protein
MKKILSDIISGVQQIIMKHYGHFTENGNYVIDKAEIPVPVARFIRQLGKWLVALS